MNLITTHLNADFDGLAGIVALSRLVGGVPVLLNPPSRSVKEYLAIYKDILQVRLFSEIHLKDFDQLYLVDVADPRRLGKYRDELCSLPLKVVDHHPDSWPELSRENKLVEELGSATTIIVERLKEQKEKISPVEATLFLLGIYEDTGRLSYPSTTSKDVRAAAFLLERGARIEAVGDFIEDSLNTREMEVFEKLLENFNEIDFKGIEIGLACADWPEEFFGVNRITEELIEITGKEAVFTVLDFGKKQVVVGRSQNEEVPVNRILSGLGGGGSTWAGSAKFKGKDMEELKNELLDLLEKEIGTSRLARDLMTVPVHTVSEEATIGQAENLMDMWGHSGLVVVSSEGKVTGIFSQRDLAKVKKHGLLHAPVKGYMSRRVISCSPTTPVSSVQRLMVKHDIGRIPVIDEEKNLLGIITRTDIIKSFYSGGDAAPQNPYGGSITSIRPRITSRQDLLEKLPEDVLSTLRLAGRIAENLGQKLYLVGGSVRDLFLQRKSPDLDLVLEGNVTILLKELERELGYNAEVYNAFGTARLVIENRVYDFASTRREEYPSPAALPLVQPATLREDLYRRDFTINALALSVSPSDWGKLIDYFGGEEDIKRKLLRVLHTFSFTDDPIRAIRAVRFSLGLGFKPEKNTLELITHLTEQGLWKHLKRPRLREELERVFFSAPLWKAVRTLEEWRIWNGILPDLKVTEERLNLLQKMEEIYSNFSGDITRETAWKLIFLTFVNCRWQKGDFEDWGFPGSIWQEVKKARSKSKNMLEKLFQELSNYSLYNLLNNQTLEYIAFLCALGIEQGNNSVLNNINRFMKKLKNVQLEIDGNDLRELGIEPGPEIKNLLDKVLEARLEGRISGRDSQLKYVRQLIRGKGGRH